MKLAVGFDEEVVPWVASRIPAVLTPENFGPCVSIGVVDDRADKILAGVVYHNAQPRFKALEVSMAAGDSRWMSRAVVNSLLAYPFVQLGCVRITAIVSRKNKRTMKLLHGLGFVREGLIRRGFVNQDAVIFGMLAKEWRNSRWAQPKADGSLRLAEVA